MRFLGGTNLKTREIYLWSIKGIGVTFLAIIICNTNDK